MVDNLAETRILNFIEIVEYIHPTVAFAVTAKETRNSPHVNDV